MIHKRAGLYLASLDSMWSKFQMQTRRRLQFWRMRETPLKQTYKLNAVIYRCETELEVTRKFKTKLWNPIQILLKFVKSNPNPSQSWKSAGFKSKSMVISGRLSGSHLFHYLQYISLNYWGKHKRKM